MNDWLGLSILLLFAFGAWFGLRALSKPRQLTEQDFEKRVNKGRSLVNAGMMELNKFLNPQAAKSIEVIQNLKNGRYNKKRQSGKEGGNEKTDLEKQ
jgi:hypothetical protein